MELVKKASQYIKDNAQIVDPTYRSSFHMEPTVGWMNDPNGLIYLNGKFHLFYQANPFSAKNEKMAWGHFISEDLIKYHEVEVALYPDISLEESGCFSGSAFVENDELKLVYTRHLDLPNNGGCIENQYLCQTQDGIQFVKDEKPCVDPNELPDELDKKEFRDPQIFYRNGRCYLIIGGHTLDQRGVFIIFSGKDSSSLHYDFYLGPYEHTYRMVECPSFVEVDGKDVIIFSTYGMDNSSTAYVWTHLVFYMLGKFDPEHKTFIIEGEGRVDDADSFYAPKTIEYAPEPVMIGWMENWNKVYKTAIFGHNWVGSFSIPRLLKIKNNELYQQICPSLYKYVGEKEIIANGGKIDIHSLNEFSFNSDFNLTLRRQNGRIKIFKKDDYIYLDMLRTNNLHEMSFASNHKYKTGKVTFLLDTSSIEVFVNDGRETFTSRFYLRGECFEAENDGCLNLTTQKVEVK